MGDIFVPLLVCFIFFTCIVHCFKRRKRTFISTGLSPGVTVTTTHVASPVVNPPYPMVPSHPTPAPIQIGFTGVPVSAYPTEGIASNIPAQGVYPHQHPTHTSPSPYIPTNSSISPYPPPNIGICPSGATRPSAPSYDVQPPSYSEAIAQTHEKQTAYNPHY
ncbi:hypothetical protein WA026_019109 [Henosepilachna vigintioctopunctata]|uniref:Uncharacterized protein n=1 Tax=Henosepilachna vigintioctopunctata TaxID=420089 RepID=A0AAW1VEI4_9CUCU